MYANLCCRLPAVGWVQEPPQIEASHSHGGGLTKVLLSMITVFLIDFITAIGGCQECHVQSAH
jgi:hypothetical protein